MNFLSPKAQIIIIPDERDSFSKKLNCLILVSLYCLRKRQYFFIFFWGGGMGGS